MKKRIPNYRTKIKRELATALFEIEAETEEQKLERYDLGLRLVQFFEYEQDPEFEKIFNDFCYNKK